LTQVYHHFDRRLQKINTEGSLKMRQQSTAVIILIVASGLITTHSQRSHAAEPTSNNIEEIIVAGQVNDLVGEPQTATEGLIFDTQLKLRPVSRSAELLEFIPGVIATQHSGEGKANQYFLRGFNLDHGTDLAIRVDGMPVNMPTHTHGQGYADINFVIPELIDSLSYRKGPYYAQIGDFATAGSTELAVVDDLQQGYASLTVGQNDYQRIFAGQSFVAGEGKLTLAGAATRYGGPWQLDQDLNERKGLVKFHQESERSAWNLTAMSYDNSWNATDQIPLRALDSGSLDRFGTIDPSSGGDSRRRSLSYNWQQNQDVSRWKINAYAMDYDLDLFSNFTYFMEDPLRGDQFQQSDQRHVFGFDSEYRYQTEIFDTPSEVSFGLQTRYDDIDTGLYKTMQRTVFATTREDSIKQSLSSSWVAVQQQWSKNFRSVAGLRLDHYRFDVTADIPDNSGAGAETLVSPKLNLIYSPPGQTEYYFSVGQGFHSNDARGATITIDPVSGEPVDKVDPLAKARSIELGLRNSIIPKTRITISTFLMALESELVYVGDAGATEAREKSRRRGIEVSALYAPTSWLLLDTDITVTHARFSGVGADNHIPNSVSHTASFGLIVHEADQWSGGLRLRYLGKAPLSESGRPRSESTLLVNLQSVYQINPRFTATLELLNLLDSQDHDISYFYQSQLSDETAPQEDIHFHPVEPRSLRLTLQARF